MSPLLVLGQRHLRRRLGLRGDHRRPRPLHPDGGAHRRRFPVLVLSVAHRRDLSGAAGPRMGAGREAGVLGAVGSIGGLATGGCTVMGCGAPMLPVMGLAFAGLSSTTLSLLAQVSTYATIAVIGGMGLGVTCLA